jgi:hypothetical protein
MVREKEKLRGTILRFAIYHAAASLKQADGRVAGIKFNKLMFKLGNIEPRLRLPYRWYLYGAVLDSSELKGYVEFDHPEDETKTNVRVPYREPPLPPQLTDAGEKIKEHCEKFVRDFAGSDAFYSMLEDHYRSAPLEFQRAYLRINKALEELSSQRAPPGKRFEALHKDAAKSFSKLESAYLKDGIAIEPRMKESALRVFLAARCLVEGGESDKARDLLFELWKVFCLFLSARKNENIHPSRLESYLARAEKALEDYRRHLPGELDAIYKEIGTPGRVDKGIQAGLTRAAMEQYDRHGGS